MHPPGLPRAPPPPGLPRASPLCPAFLFGVQGPRAGLVRTLTGHPPSPGTVAGPQESEQSLRAERLLSVQELLLLSLQWAAPAVLTLTAVGQQVLNPVPSGLGGGCCSPEGHGGGGWGGCCLDRLLPALRDPFPSGQAART